MLTSITCYCISEVKTKTSSDVEMIYNNYLAAVFILTK